jgi:hypothetical protein
MPIINGSSDASAGLSRRMLLGVSALGGLAATVGVATPAFARAPNTLANGWTSSTATRT